MKYLEVHGKYQASMAIDTLWKTVIVTIRTGSIETVIHVVCYRWVNGDVGRY